MKSAVETLTPTRVKLSVEVDEAELKPSLDEAYKTIGQQVNVPGFRKGKVPARIIDQRFGRGAVVQQALDAKLPDLYRDAMLENDLTPLGQPELNITELPVEAGKDLKFEAEVDVVPTFDIPEFDDVTVEVDPVTVSEEDVTARVDELRTRFGTLVGVEREAADGDFLSIDIRGTIEDEEIETAEAVSYELGSKTMIEGLDEAVTGAKAGETVTFEAPLAGGDRQGEIATITITVNSVKERQLPELDDEFAQLASEFDTWEELDADLRSQAEKAAGLQQQVQARDKLLEKLLEIVEIPVPENVVEQEVHNHLEGEDRLEDDEHRAEVTESTTNGLKSQFLLDALVNRYEVEVSQNELVEYIIGTAQQYNVNPNEFAQQIDQQGQVPMIVAEVGRRKALAVVLEKATVVDTEGNAVEIETAPEADESADAAQQAPGDAAEVEGDDVEVIEVDGADDEAADDSETDETADETSKA